MHATPYKLEKKTKIARKKALAGTRCEKKRKESGVCVARAEGGASVEIQWSLYVKYRISEMNNSEAETRD
jgi:hypothetical protein